MLLKGGSIRKLIVVVDELYCVATRTLPSGAAKKVLAAAVISNPLAKSTRVDDKLDGLIELGAEVGAVLGERAMNALDAPVVSYGKAVIVGTNGQLEHGAALLHPKFGATVRRAIGHGVDIMPSTKKGPSAAGTGIDVPLHGKDNVWSFPEMDGFAFSGVADAPLPDEILLILAVSGGRRPFARIGDGAPNDFLVPKP